MTEPDAVDQEHAGQVEMMRRAALDWVDSLSPEQRVAGVWAGPGDATAEAERIRWFYTPTDHGGLTLGAQQPTQQQRVMRLLATGMSTAGYVTVSTILGWENVLDLVEDFGVSWGRERGRDPGLYYLRVFGDPRADAAWAWRFGGHHISLNFLVIEGRVRATTPCFLGADPAAYPALGGAVLRPLARLEDLARELVGSLDPGQRQAALVAEHAPEDLIGGNRTRIGPGDQLIGLPDLWRDRFVDPRLAERVATIAATSAAATGLSETHRARLAMSSTPLGLAGSSLTATQRDLLAAVVATYTDRVAAPFVPELDLDAVHFAWAGPVEAGQPHYYRLQGPRFLAEWDNTQRNANHAHSVWRDPDGDFGIDVLTAHRRGLLP